jgi:uncharacterized protein YndB with AHSA1/START domain
MDGTTLTQIAGQDTSLPLVQRSMTDREIGAGAARAAVLRRRFDAPVADVWSAITRPNRVDRYFLPVTVDAGTYAFQGQASGRILACDAPTLLRLEWIPPDRETVDEVSLHLTADGPDATWLELTHASVADVFHTDLTADKFSPAIGWEGPLHYLGEHLRGALPDRPSMEWYEFDEAEEMRLAKLRAPEWEKAEARHAAS